MSMIENKWYQPTEEAIVLNEADFFTFPALTRLDWLPLRLCTRKVILTSISPLYFSAFLEPGLFFRVYHLKRQMLASGEMQVMQLRFRYRKWSSKRKVSLKDTKHVTWNDYAQKSCKRSLINMRNSNHGFIVQPLNIYKNPIMKNDHFWRACFNAIIRDAPD